MYFGIYHIPANIIKPFLIAHFLLIVARVMGMYGSIRVLYVQQQYCLLTSTAAVPHN